LAENAVLVNGEPAISDRALLDNKDGWGEQVDRGSMNETGVSTSFAGNELSLPAFSGLMPNAKVPNEADVLAQAIRDGEFEGCHGFGL
jgi:hypothetical protein